MKRSDRGYSLEKVKSWGMCCIVKMIKEQPLLPFSLEHIKRKCNLRRNDMINARRQLKKINDAKGAIRFIEPNRTHIVFIPDDIKTEVEIEAALAAASALSHLGKKIPTNCAKPAENLTNYIHQSLLT